MVRLSGDRLTLALDEETLYVRSNRMVRLLKNCTIIIYPSIGKKAPAYNTQGFSPKDLTGDELPTEFINSEEKLCLESKSCLPR